MEVGKTEEHIHYLNFETSSGLILEYPDYLHILESTNSKKPDVIRKFYFYGNDSGQVKEDYLSVLPSFIFIKSTCYNKIVI